MGKIKPYTVTLEKEVVEKAQERMGNTGQKLSPVINNLIKIWTAYKEEVQALIDKLNKEEKS